MGRVRRWGDQLAVEEPLEISHCLWAARGADDSKAVAVTTAHTRRGNERILSWRWGFLFAEGIVREKGQVERVIYCGPETGKLRVAQRGACGIGAGGERGPGAGWSGIFT